MSETTARVVQAIENASSQYYRLVILVGGPASGKTTAMQSVVQQLGCQLVNVNLELSRRMLGLTRTLRSGQVARLLKEVVGAAPGDLVLLDNLEILFDTSLEIDPLRLLQMSSRNHTLVASWNGSYQAGTLTYAEPGHPEFNQFKQIEAIVITVGTIVNS